MFFRFTIFSVMGVFKSHGYFLISLPFNPNSSKKSNMWTILELFATNSL
jgi:hypothetical protein